MAKEKTLLDFLCMIDDESHICMSKVIDSDKAKQILLEYEKELEKHVCSNCAHYEKRDEVPGWNICTKLADYRIGDWSCKDFEYA